jgi:hypothetical protein
MMSEIANDADDAELYGRVAPELIRFATALVGRVDRSLRPACRRT